MDFKEAQDQLQRLQAEEDHRTIEFLITRLNTQTAVLDLSNKFLFDEAVEVLIKEVGRHYSERNTLRKVVLQNTMLEEERLNNVLRGLLGVKRQMALTWLDIGNNRIDLKAESGELLGKLLSKRTNHKPKTLVLQGNLVREASFMTALFNSAGTLAELNLYDTRLSPLALAALGEILCLNKRIIRLDLGYNASAFTTKSILSTFGMGISLNHHLEWLSLCGNTPLRKPKLLTALCSGLQCSKSLEYCSLGGLSLGDRGISLLTRYLLPAVPICHLDLHNNSLASKGLARLLRLLPVHITALDLSYNQIKDESLLTLVADLLLRTRSLRLLNISHTIEIEEVSYKAKGRLAEALKENDSLTEFYCEGAKIGGDPDDFCEVLGAAIGERRLSLTFKISAVDCFKGSNQASSYGEASSSQVKSLELPQEPRPPQVNSTLQTERRNFEAGSRKESLSQTPREYCFAAGTSEGEGSNI